MDFFNDISKELTKDVNGQKIYYYSICSERTKIDPVYEEAVEKIYDGPFEIECWIDWQPPEVTTTKFGHDKLLKIKVYIQSRDLIEKEFDLKDGDFFSYGTEFFEIASLRNMRNIYGQVEYDDGIELVGIQTRDDQFISRVLGPTRESYSDPDAVQNSFYQQRGFVENKQGKTGDVRDLIKKGVLDAPISPPSEISKRSSNSNAANTFYNEDDD